jgi:hypothetical protein
MRHNRKTCYAYRIQLEKLKFRNLRWIVAARVLVILALLMSHYLK